MNVPQSRTNRGIVLVLTLGLLAAAAGGFGLGNATGQIEQPPPLDLPRPGEPANAIPEVGHAKALSKVFRHVSREALPSIVSIETRGRAVAAPGPGGGRGPVPFDDDSPFGEFFRQDPRLREFFRRQPQERTQVPQNVGSGFIIDETGVILTNSHVVRNAEEIRIRLHDGREFTAAAIHSDPRTDVAIVRIEVPDDVELKAIKLGDSDEMEIGDWVLAVGSPFGLDLTVTAGIISAKGRGLPITERADFLQTDAAMNPGNSGGPLLNLDGEVIGINTAISTRSGGSHGVGFAIPVNMAKWVARQLMERGEVARAYLGVSIQEIDHALARQFRTRPGEGVLVSGVMPDSPAANARLRPGDIILDLDNRRVNSPRNLQGIVEQLDVERPYEMTVLRDGRRMTLDVTFGRMPDEFALNGAPAVERERPRERTRKFEQLGIEVRELTRESARELGLRDARGVLVASVEEGSPAHRAGLRGDEVIEEINRRPVRTPEEFADAVENASLEEGVLILVRDARGTRFLSIPAR